MAARHAEPERRRRPGCRDRRAGRGGFGEASAAARLTAIVDLPTPPLLFRTAMITGNLSGILSRNARPARASHGRQSCNASASAAAAVRRATLQHLTEQDAGSRKRDSGTAGHGSLRMAERKRRRRRRCGRGARRGRGGRVARRRRGRGRSRRRCGGSRRSRTTSRSKRRCSTALRQLLALERELGAARLPDRRHDATASWAPTAAISARRSRCPTIRRSRPAACC